MSGKKVHAVFKGYQQIFPEQLDKLNELYDRIGATGEFFQAVGLNFGYSVEHNPKTEDGLDWFWGIYAPLMKGAIAILFPWAQDFQKADNLRLDRSIATYVRGIVAPQEVEGFLEMLCQSFLKKEEQQKLNLDFGWKLLRE